MVGRGWAKRSYVLVPEDGAPCTSELHQPASSPPNAPRACEASQGKATVQPSHRPGDAPQETSSATGDAAMGVFFLLYESKDGQLCTFEDAEGHLTSVNSQRMV